MLWVTATTVFSLPPEDSKLENQASCCELDLAQDFPPIKAQVPFWSTVPQRSTGDLNLCSASASGSTAGQGHPSVPSLLEHLCLPGAKHLFSVHILEFFRFNKKRKTSSTFVQTHPCLFVLQTSVLILWVWLILSGANPRSPMSPPPPQQRFIKLSTTFLKTQLRTNAFSQEADRHAACLSARDTGRPLLVCLILNFPVEPGLVFRPKSSTSPPRPW